MNFRSLATVAALVCLSACKIVIDVPAGGRLATESGRVECEPEASCTVEVVDVFFDETFIARPQPGYAFDGWKKAERHFCGDSNAPCRLFTRFFEGNEALLEILESDSEFYLSPQFRLRNVFTTVTDIPVGGVARASCFARGRLYVFGAGWETGASLNSSQAYNPVTDRWSRRRPLPSERPWATATALNQHCYVLGGAESSAVTDRVDVYNPANNTWRSAAPLPEPLFSAASAVLGGKLYVAGGSTGFLSSVAPVTNSLFIYDPKSNSWSRGAPMPTARRRLSLSAAGGLIYAAGGDLARNTPTDVVEIYNPATNKWRSGVPIPEPRAAHAGAAFNGALYVFGGFSET